jgi:HSP20 family protein
MKIIVDSTAPPPGPPRWTPNTDVALTVTGEMVVTVELAGLTRDDLELAIDGTRLRISGLRRNEDHPEVSSYLVMEIANGPFEIVFEVPTPYDLSQARAVYEIGFLRIQIPPRRT